jgi:5-methylcytosine-specific restriction endonuclease McrA
MNLTDYFSYRVQNAVRAKIGSASITHPEAKLLGIPFPLQKGWKKRYGEMNIPFALALQAKGARADVKKHKTKAQKRADKALQSSFSRSKGVAQPRPVMKNHQHQPTQASVQNFIQKHSTVNPLSDDFLHTFEWNAVRMMALKRYGVVCQCCGASPSTGAVMNVDHIKPRKIFPNLALEVDNLQVLCNDCNKGKGNWDMTDWRRVAATTIS